MPQGTSILRIQALWLQVGGKDFIFTILIQYCVRLIVDDIFRNKVCILDHSLNRSKRRRFIVMESDTENYKRIRLPVIATAFALGPVKFQSFLSPSLFSVLVFSQS